jgi:sec-independent protein translocase protein TatC
MLLTPPDIISQTMLAVPIYILFELGILMSRMFSSKAPEPSEEAAVK